MARSKGSSKSVRVKFEDFRKIACKLRTAAETIPAGRGLMSEINKAATIERKLVFIRWGTTLCQELYQWRALLREATAAPTKCTELIAGYPDAITIV